MEERVYQSSVFWSASRFMADFAQFFWPFLLAVAVLVWVWRSRRVPTISTLAGVALMLAGHITHIAGPKLSIVALGAPQPADDSNPLLVFLFLHAFHLGMLVVAISLCAEHMRRRNNA
jgi:hypothetical protein